MFKLLLEKAEEPEIKLPTSSGSSKKQESSRKTSISALLTMVPKPLTVWITVNCGKFWKRREYQTTWPASWETYMQVRKQARVRAGHGTTDWFQIGKGVCQGVLSWCRAHHEKHWAGRITTNKASRGDGIPVELFQILKDDAVKVLHSTCQQIWKTQQWPQDWKRSVSFQSQRKAMPKNVQTTAQLHSSHMLAK